MKHWSLFLVFFASVTVCFGQTVTDQKEAERIYRQSLKDSKIESQYALANDKCQKLLRGKKFSEAEAVCRLAAVHSEKLPLNRFMERYSAYRTLGIALLWQRKVEHAIGFFDKSLKVARPHLEDTSTETADIYYFLGQANYLIGKFDKAREFFIKAENIYRNAVKEVGDDDFFLPLYAKALTGILESHLTTAEKLNLKDEVIKVKRRLEDTKTEFNKYLEN